MALAMLMVLMIPATVLAAPDTKLDKRDISSEQCRIEHAKKVVDVHYTLLNGYDSGVAGNAWANDTIKRHLEIWQGGDGLFCVRVADEGTFVTFAGPSPSGGSTISAGLEGHLNGGWVSNFFGGTFSPTRPTHGELGAFDLACTAAYTCSGSHPIYTDYFGTLSGDEPFTQWDWVYKAGKHGTWLNQDSGNAGDITD